MMYISRHFPDNSQLYGNARRSTPPIGSCLLGFFGRFNGTRLLPVAAINGNEIGLRIRDVVAQKMTPSQLKKAKDLARKCIRKEYKGC